MEINIALGRASGGSSPNTRSWWNSVETKEVSNEMYEEASLFRALSCLSITAIAKRKLHKNYHGFLSWL